MVKVRELNRKNSRDLKNYIRRLAYYHMDDAYCKSQKSKRKKNRDSTKNLDALWISPVSVLCRIRENILDNKPLEKDLYTYKFALYYDSYDALLYNKTMYMSLVVSLFISGVAAIFGILTALVNIAIIDKIQQTRLENNKYTVPSAIFCCLVYTAIATACILFNLGKFGYLDNQHLTTWLTMSAGSICEFSLIGSIAFLIITTSKVCRQVSAIKQANEAWNIILKSDINVVLEDGENPPSTQLNNSSTHSTDTYYLLQKDRFMLVRRYS